MCRYHLDSNAPLSTDLGRNLAELLNQIRVWSERHAADIKRARALAASDSMEKQELIAEV
jgi:hypothetical protein